jgi:hypothetical protein
VLDSSLSNRSNLILFGRTLLKAINKLHRQKPIVPLIWSPLKFSRPCGAHFAIDSHAHAKVLIDTAIAGTAKACPSNSCG